uniref:Uncharacterized protein AlNc14C206G8809 n=1 Tax=Albugo laibachii Nc14 TaxID=890382 RepID=F0WR01_9STRA|nr:hypothetical protein THAPSDRAFT_30887 [Albugo laibachii Nc14]|eukprot:CCA23761.1 hypothetical protein THAPSDRAFT_30887 [Albugo laibachii Nc14]
MCQLSPKCADGAPLWSAPIKYRSGHFDCPESPLLTQRRVSKDNYCEKYDESLCQVDEFPASDSNQNDSGDVTLDVEDLGNDIHLDHKAIEEADELVCVDYEEDLVVQRPRGADLCFVGEACRPIQMLSVVTESYHSTASRRRVGKSVVPTLRESDLDRYDTSHECISICKDVPKRCSGLHKLCLCEVRNHRGMDSCWIVSKNNVYDVTGLILAHPGGTKSILRKAGGVDCTKDMNFHSKRARKTLEKCFIGKLESCGDSNTVSDSQRACSIM